MTTAAIDSNRQNIESKLNSRRFMNPRGGRHLTVLFYYAAQAFREVGEAARCVGEGVGEADDPFATHFCDRGLRH